MTGKAEQKIKERIRIIKGDITEQDVDAIVNAANNTLLGGGGVDGAIHRAAGPELLKECRALNGCPTGEARITGGYRLPARHVIHTVGPVWRGGRANEDELLASSYRNSLTLAATHELKSVAFPSISTGVYGFPVERAAAIAINEIWSFLEDHTSIEQVVMVLFNEAAYKSYTEALKVKREINRRSLT